MRPRFPLRVGFVVVAAVVVVAWSAFAGAAGGASVTIAGSVTQLADGSAIPGAVVTLAGPNQPPVSVRADASGGFSIDASGAGPFSLGVIATGFNSQAVGGVTPGRSVQVVLSASTYVPLGLYDGSSQEVVADVRSGTFYSLMRGAQEVYRTVDYGGRWQPVTMSYDDPATASPISTASTTRWRSAASRARWRSRRASTALWVRE